MKILLINQNQIERAKKLYEFINLKGSITKGNSNIYGAIGEIIVYDYFKNKGLDIDFTSTFDYDIIINNLKIDVKTKRTNVEPKENYLCSISAFNTKQKCDYYFFLRVKEDLSTAYLLGYSNKKEFYNKAIFKKKGEIDINGFSFKDDCYNLEINSLNKFK